MYHFFLVIFIQLLLPPFWMLIFYLWFDARGSGWKNLARLYRATEKPSGRTFEKATLSINARRYREIALIALNSDGLYVELAPPFSFLHPPIMVPWRKMRAIEMGSTTEFVLSAPILVRLKLTEPVLHEAIRQFELNSPQLAPMPQGKSRSAA
jgi:hypothetical protein